MISKRAKSLTIISVIVIICAIILFAFFRTDKATRTALKQHQAEMAAIEQRQAEKTAAQAEGLESVLGYTVVSQVDISVSDTPRMMYRIVLDVNKIPNENDIRDTGISIWKDGNTFWEEFTVFVYLPEMQTDNAAYAVCEFGPDGLLKFQINEDNIQGTKWE